MEYWDESIPEYDMKSCIDPDWDQEFSFDPELDQDHSIEPLRDSQSAMFPETESGLIVLLAIIVFLGYSGTLKGSGSSRRVL